MKKNKRLIILLIILVILIVLAVITNTYYPKDEFSYTFIRGEEWIINDAENNETLYLEENYKFIYYDNKTGETVKDYEKCSTYELNGNKLKLNCDKVIKIISASDTKLYLKIDGKTKIFEKKTEKNYKVFQVGYLTNINSPVLFSKYEDFINYIDTHNIKFYGEDGVEATSTDSLKFYYPERYFDDLNVAIYYIETSSGSIKINNVKTLINEDTVSIKYNLLTPEIGTMDMNGFMIAVEVPKTVTKVK